MKHRNAKPILAYKIGFSDQNTNSIQYTSLSVRLKFSYSLGKLMLKGQLIYEYIISWVMLIVEHYLFYHSPGSSDDIFFKSSGKIGMSRGSPYGVDPSITSCCNPV